MAEAPVMARIDGRTPVAWRVLSAARAIVSREHDVVDVPHPRLLEWARFILLANPWPDGVDIDRVHYAVS